MIKSFLRDLYNAWRPLEGLPVAPTYNEAKQGHVHYEREKDIKVTKPSTMPNRQGGGDGAHIGV
jgi:hypothetical protein